MKNKALFIMLLSLFLVFSLAFVSANKYYQQDHRLVYKTIIYDHKDRDIFVQIYDPYYYRYRGPEFYYTYQPFYYPYNKPYHLSFYNPHPHGDYRVRSIKFYSPYENIKYRSIDNYNYQIRY